MYYLMFIKLFVNNMHRDILLTISVDFISHWF